MKVYWDTKDRSFIIENENGKRMRITSGKVEADPFADHIIMTDAVLVHEVDALDMASIGDKVHPDKIAREGVVLRLIGTNCYIVYCENQWRMKNGNGLGFNVDEAVLYSKRDDVFLKIIRNRLTEW